MKSADRILAGRYARAFDALSKDGAEASAHFAALRQAAQALRGAKAYMDDPAVPSADKLAFAKRALSADKRVEGFVSALLEAKRYYLLDACVDEVGALLDSRLGIVRAKVQTAFELTPQQKKKVEEALGQFAGKDIRAEYKTDPSLLGGLCARLGDVLIDGTLKGRFEKLQEELTK